MPTPVPLEEFRRSSQAYLFEGDRHGDVDFSFFFVEAEPGNGASLHLHPYPEVFLVHAGQGTFTVGEQTVVVEAGHVLVIPPETPHGFTNTGTGILRTFSVHPSGTVRQTNLTAR